MKWYENYKTRKWKLYTVEIESPDDMLLRESLDDSGLIVCGEESELGEQEWKRTGSLKNVTFFDVEQILSWELDDVYGVYLFGVLTREWKGHPAGSLVLSVFSGVRLEDTVLADPPVAPTVTVGVEITE